MKVNSIKVSLAVIVSALFACVLSAKAVTIDGYDLTTITGSFGDSGTALILEAQPWWGNSTLSYQLASDLGNLLGTPNPQTGSTGVGPYFAETTTPPDPTAYLLGYAWVSGPGTPYTSNFGLDEGGTDTFAVLVPEPGTLSLVGIGIGAMGLLARRSRSSRRTSAR